MFDDYDYKMTHKRINLRFVQREDEPMYPWEIAGFLSHLNTSYYKFELLNSICSALRHGIAPEDIFVFDKSLPLYERYAELNLLQEPYAATLFYPIGRPYPLVPSRGIYEYNFLYQAFYQINSYLASNHVKPLPIINIAKAYDVLRTSGLEQAEADIISWAEIRAAKSAENARKKNKEFKALTKSDIVSCLQKYRSGKNRLLEDLSLLETLSDDEREKLLLSNKQRDKRLASVLLSFFTYFHRTTRPLVCVRVAPGQFRVLGRSLVNKAEQTGLELKEIVRNSPLGAVFQGGIAAVQATLQETRNKELHELELQKKKVELLKAHEELEGERLKNMQRRVSILKDLQETVKGSDVEAIHELKASFTKQLLMETYNQERLNSRYLLDGRGLNLDIQSTRIIDVTV